MKKTAKKLFSAVCCIAMLITLLPAASAQADNVSILKIEDITNHQPANLITEDITLPNGYTYTATPAGVIDTATGAVTRDAVNDVEVTLTASNEESSKDFKLIVKSKKTKVYVRESFSYSDSAYKENPVAQSDFIFNAGNISVQNCSKIETEENGNSYFFLDWTGTDSLKKTVVLNNFSAGSTLRNLFNDENSTNVYVSFNYRLIKGATDKLYGGIVKFNGTAEVATVGERYDTFAFRTGTKVLFDTTYKGDGTDAWKRGVIRYNTEDKTVAISADGSTFTEPVALQLSDNNVMTFEISPFWSGGDSGKFYIDDFSIYTESLDNVAKIEKGDSGVSVVGNTSGGMLFVAKFDESNKLTSTSVYEDNFSNISLPDGNCRCFFLEKNTLRPLAFSK